MRRTRLDLAALRENRLPQPPEREPSLSQVVQSDDPMMLSRREMIGLAGAAAVTLQPGAKALTSALLGSFDLATGPGRAVFSLGGKECWVIDVRRFAGSPQLTVERGEGLVRLTLAGAQYPGTDLPADFICEIRRSIVNWRMKINFALGAMRAECSFERWLMGQEPARGRMTLNTRACPLDGVAQVGFVGTADGELRPDWSLRISGTGVARVYGLAGGLAADAATVALLDPTAPSMLRTLPAKRTLISLERGGNAWSLHETIAMPDNGRLVTDDEPFDAIQIEAGEARNRETPRALLAWSNSSASRLSYEPAGGHRGSDGQPFRLPLRDVRYAISYGPGGEQTVLTGQFSRDPVWLHADGCSLQVGDHAPGGDGAPEARFEVFGRRGHVEAMRCAPALLSIAAPLPGVIVEPTPVADGAYLNFVADTNKPLILKPVQVAPVVTNRPPTTTPGAVKPITGPVKIAPKTPIKVGPVSPVKIILPNFTVSVVRPDDMLVLRFEFVNMRLTVGGGASQIAIEDPSKAAYMVVHFPPQHIAEEAIWESDPNLPATTPSDQANTGSESLPAPPVQSCISGPSRVVFNVPAGSKPIPYTIEGLLDWTHFEMSLNPRAHDAPPSPLKAIGPNSPLTPVVMPQPKTPIGAGARVRERLSVPATIKPVGTVGMVKGGVIPIVRPNLALVDTALLLKVTAPGPMQTAIEAPYRLMLSPNVMAGWVHSFTQVSNQPTAAAVKPVSRQLRATSGVLTPIVSAALPRTELWHSRMAMRSGDGTFHDGRYVYGWDAAGKFRVVAISANTDEYDHYATMRAIWSPDYLGKGTGPGANMAAKFLMSLDWADRYEIVRLTSDYDMVYQDGPEKGRKLAPKPVNAESFMLSSLGAWMNVRGGWDFHQGLGFSVEEWRNRTAMGRDTYVRVVYKGYLYPFGHRASLVKVTERKIEQTGGGYVAYLRQRMFIVVREPEKTFGATGIKIPATGDHGEWSLDRRMPFKRVRITTLVTPNIQKPDNLIPGGSDREGFLPIVGSQPFRFHMVCEDGDGQSTEMAAPLYFVSSENDAAYTASSVQYVADAYNKLDKKPSDVNTAQTAGQKVSFADSGKPGDTTLETQSITFSGYVVPQNVNLPLDQPRFYPVVTESKVRVPAVEAMASSGQEPSVKISDAYLTHGWDTAAGRNKGEVFAELVNKMPFQFPSEKGGGLAVPNMDVGGLSRSFGPIGGAASDLAGGNFDPTTFFANAAKILGAVSLGDIIPKGFGDGVNIPKLVTTIDRDAQGIPRKASVTLDWAPTIHDFNPIFLASIKNGANKAALTFHALLETPLVPGGSAPGSPSYDVKVSLTNFTVALICIGCEFNALEFVSATGKKTDVNCDVGNIVFLGPLKFVNTLRDILPLDGFKDPPSLDIDASGVSIGFTLPIPDVTVGVMSLQNMALSAGLKLSFFGDPVTLSFAFCSRENPFLITVTIFGGGGFFGIEITPAGLKMMEASFEFGGNFDLNIGVASGGVHIMVGIYFKKSDDDTLLTGFVDCGGSVCVLGIITISVDFYLSLNYEETGGHSRCWGQATLTVEISILFFSIGVSMTVEKEFAGSSGGSASLDGVRLAMLPEDEQRYAKTEGRSINGSSTPKPPTVTDTLTPADWLTYCQAFA